MFMVFSEYILLIKLFQNLFSGLCMGCSLVTIFEVLHHIVLIFLRTSVKSVNRIHKTIRCAPRTDEPPSGITMAAFMQLGSNINVFAPNPGMYFNFFYCFVKPCFAINNFGNYGSQNY